MKKFLSKFSKQSRGEKGFTLIELLIVIAILGILAAVIIPNVTSFITSGKVSAANSELASIQTAQEAYLADSGGAYAGTSAALTPYLQGTLKGTYTFSTTTGLVLTADCTASSWGTAIDFKLSTQQWQRGTTGKQI
jgi:type IV pilus assembly protein PilA